MHLMLRPNCLTLCKRGVRWKRNKHSHDTEKISEPKTPPGSKAGAEAHCVTGAQFAAVSSNPLKDLWTNDFLILYTCSGRGEKV